VTSSHPFNFSNILINDSLKQLYSPDDWESQPVNSFEVEPVTFRHLLNMFAGEQNSPVDRESQQVNNPEVTAFSTSPPTY
jgi:hypothetical protein